ncbi:MAG: hypothetical protein ACYC27_07750 [Armatimonadota bacterium]
MFQIAIRMVGLLAICSMISSTLCASENNISRFPLHKDGSVKYWMLCLTFPNPEVGDSRTGSLEALDKDYLAPVGGESNIIPSPGMEVPSESGPVKWFAKGCVEHINLWLYAKEKGNVTGYGFMYLEADQDMDVTIKTGNSDPMRIWLNGEPIFTETSERAPSAGTDKVDVTLRKGLNRILVKSSQGIYEWGYMFQVVGRDNKVPSGVRIALPVSTKNIPDNVGEYPAAKGDILPRLNAGKFTNIQYALDMHMQIGNSRISSPVRSALDKFNGRLSQLGVHTSVSYGRDRTGSGQTIVLDYLRNASKWDAGALPDDAKNLKTPESYVILSRGNRLFVLSTDDMGIVYGLSFLQTRLWKENQTAVLHLDKPESVNQPSFSRRGIYVMYGYNYAGIEVHDWGIKEWQSYIDELILARLNYVYIYLWTSEWGYMPGTAGYNPKNKRIHETLRSVIRYAHKRGIKVCYMMTPCLLPSDLYDKERSAFSDNPFIKDWKFACTENPRAKELMEKLIRAQLVYMKEADSFQIAFFDPGGCKCDLCMKDMAVTLYNQVRQWSAIVKENNPKAELSLNFWPFKVEEDWHKIIFTERLLEMIKKDFGTSIDICESADIERVYLHTAKKMGFSTTAFIFPTNPETSYLLPIISGDIWKPYLKRMHNEWGFDRAMFQRMEVKTRGVQDWLMGSLYWSPDSGLDRLTYIYGCYNIGDSVPGEKFARVLKEIDEFTSIMQESGSDRKLLLGESIEKETIALASSLPHDKRWYVESARLYSVLGKAIYAQDQIYSNLNPDWQTEVDKQRAEFIRRVKAGKFYGHALQDEAVIGNLFDSYIGWLSIGRTSMLF